MESNKVGTEQTIDQEKTNEDAVPVYKTETAKPVDAATE